MRVGLATLTPVPAVPPKDTVAPGRKFAPVIVVRVPPTVGPKDGDTAVTSSTGATYGKMHTPAALPTSGARSVFVRVWNCIATEQPPSRWQ
jgi:hypothetical protein